MALCLTGAGNLARKLACSCLTNTVNGVVRSSLRLDPYGLRSGLLWAVAVVHKVDPLRPIIKVPSNLATTLMLVITLTPTVNLQVLFSHLTMSPCAGSFFC